MCMRFFAFYRSFRKSQRPVGQMSLQIGGQLEFAEKGQRLVDQIGHQLGDQLEILNKVSKLLTNYQKQIVNESLTKFVTRLVTD